MNGSKTSRTDRTAESGYSSTKQNDKVTEKDTQALQSGCRPMGNEIPQFERRTPKTGCFETASGNDAGTDQPDNAAESGEASSDGGNEESGEDSTGTDGELESGQDGTGDAGGTEQETGGVQSAVGGAERESVSGDTATEEVDSVDEGLHESAGDTGTGEEGTEGESGFDAGGNSGTSETSSGESGEPVEEESGAEYITTYSTEENNYSTVVTENYSDILIVFLLAALIGIIAAGILWRK